MEQETSSLNLKFLHVDKLCFLAFGFLDLTAGFYGSQSPNLRPLEQYHGRFQRPHPRLVHPLRWNHPSPLRLLPNQSTSILFYRGF